MEQKKFYSHIPYSHNVPYRFFGRISVHFGLFQSVLQIKTKIVSGHTADSKPVKQEVNSTVILPPLVFPARTNDVVPKTALGPVLLNFLRP
jgi:hypothetical protein